MKKILALLTVALISAGTFAGIANANRGCGNNWDRWDNNRCDRGCDRWDNNWDRWDDWRW